MAQFHVPPFPPYPNASRYVAVGSQDEAFNRICRAVEAFEAIALVIGPPGVGKSLLALSLVQRFLHEREIISLGDATIDSPSVLMLHLIRRLARSRGVTPTPRDQMDDLQWELIQQITNSKTETGGVLLLVDEAQSLPPEVLETIRILTNVIHQGRPLVSAVLFGGPKLDETLALPMLEAFVQRIATRCYLHPFNIDETMRYVRSVISDCGSNPAEAIEDAAMRAVHKACSGIPRLVNQLMTAAIDTAAAMNETLITPRIIDRAWAMLQQLPSPIVDEVPMKPIAKTTSTIEFGPLRDQNLIESEPAAKPAAKPPAPAKEIEQFEPVAEESFEPFTAHTKLEVVNFDDAQLCGGTIDCQSYTDIFGQFDEEEEVEVPASPAMMPQAAVASTLRNEMQDLELSLHEEILSLRGAASRPIANSPVLWINEDDPEPMNDDRDLLVVEEDVRIDGATGSDKTSFDSTPSQPVAVDFRAMLARMRSPQS